MNDLKPTEAELEILQILYEHQPCSVRHVYECLGAQREVGYTTILKQMQRMVDKGLVQRTGEGKAHLYSPVHDQETIQATLLDRMVDNVFGASVSKLVMHALGRGKASPQEIEEVRQFLGQMEQE